MQSLWSSRRKFFSLVLLILVSMLVVLVVRNLPLDHSSNRISAIRPTPSLHRAYYRQLQDVPSLVHQGERIDLTWVAQPDPSQISYAPIPIFCAIALYGPYPTEAAAEQVSNQLSSSVSSTPSSSGPRPVVMVPQLTVSNWDGQTRTSSLTIPLTLLSGYYISVASAKLDGDPEVATEFDLVQVVAS